MRIEYNLGIITEEALNELQTKGGHFASYALWDIDANAWLERSDKLIIGRKYDTFKAAKRAHWNWLRTHNVALVELYPDRPDIRIDKPISASELQAIRDDNKSFASQLVDDAVKEMGIERLTK